MSASAETPHEGLQEVAPPRRKRQRLYVPPMWVWIVEVVCLAAIVLLRLKAPDFDQANVNIGTVILILIGFWAAIIWFAFFSAYPFLLRIVVGTGALLTAVGGWATLTVALLFGLVQLDGSLVPRLRRSPPPVETSAQEDSPVDLATPPTPDDFPEFLGPGRTALVTTVLSRDWKANPPKKLWRQSIGEGWSAFSAVNGFAVTLEQDDDEEQVNCYDARTGQLKWSHAITARHFHFLGGLGPRSTPTIHQGKVYVLGATGVLHCLDGATGKPIWPSIDLLDLAGTSFEEDSARILWGRSGSPLIVDNLVVVPFGGKPAGPWKSLIAFDKATGEEVWRGGDRHVGYSSPSLAVMRGVPQILIVNENNVSGHDPKTGKELWQYDWPGSSSANANASQAVPVSDDRFLLSKGYGGGAALVQLNLGEGAWTTKEVWHNASVFKTKFTNAVVSGLYAYALSDGILECIDLESGKRQWKSGRYRQGQILGASDLLLVQAESGEVVLCEINPEKHVELGRFQAIEGITWNNLCLHGRLLLVRNGEEAACYELAGEN